LLGYVLTVLAAHCGLVNWSFATLLFLSALLYGTLSSLA